MKRLDRHIEDVVIAAYRQGCSSYAIEALCGVGHSTVCRILERRGIKARPIGAKGSKCIECGKPTGLSKRCAFHQRVRNADNLRARRERWEND